MSLPQPNDSNLVPSTAPLLSDAIAFNTRAAVASRQQQSLPSSLHHVNTTVPNAGLQNLYPATSPQSFHNSTNSITSSEQKDLDDFHDTIMTPVT